jgi:hypothetical protein
MEKIPTIKIKIYRDNEGQQWVAIGQNIRGFVITDKSYEHILEYIEWAVPDFLEIEHANIKIRTEKKISHV